MRFCELLNPNSNVYSVDGFPETLFPAVMDDLEQYPHGAELVENITEHFFEYQITIVPPWYWVRRFHAVMISSLPSDSLSFPRFFIYIEAYTSDQVNSAL